MDALERKRLEERIVEEVQTMLAEGNINYLMGFDRAGLMKALEHELRFLGLYHRDDCETPLLIHKLLEENIDQWYESYLRPRVEEKTPNPETKVQIEASPWITSFSAGTGILKKDWTQYIDFGFAK